MHDDIRGDHHPHHTPLTQATTLAVSYLQLEPVDDSELRPSQVRSLILAQHDKIRALLHMLDRRAIHLMATPVPTAGEREGTRQLGLVLCSVMVSHIEFENCVLTAALERTDGWGSIRAERLRDEHAEQLELLRAYTDTLERDSGSGAELALTAWRLVSVIAEDMEHEEATMLNSDLLSDEAIGIDVETG